VRRDAGADPEFDVMSFWFAVFLVLNNSVTLYLAVMLVITWILATCGRLLAMMRRRYERG
jgi:hypothetical protein